MMPMENILIYVCFLYPRDNLEFAGYTIQKFLPLYGVQNSAAVDIKNSSQISLQKK